MDFPPSRPTGLRALSLPLLLCLIAGSYVVAGRLGLLLAIPPGFATAIWPPAGLALVCALALGVRAALGIWSGSFLLNLWMAHLAGAHPLQGLGLAALIALGSTLQAFLGAHLVRRTLRYPSTLDQGPDILLFFLVGGPVACIVAASVGVAGLVFLEGLPWGEVLVNWTTWWVGDTLGVLAFAPILLIVLGEPQAIWRRRALPLGLPLLLAFSSVVFVFIQVRNLDRERRISAFDRHVQESSERLRRSLDHHVNLIKGLAAFIESGPQVDRGAFHAYVTRMIGDFPSVQALEWAPRIPARERASFEARVRSEGFLAFQIRERDAGGRLVPAMQRPWHVPIAFLEPLQGNESALGFDLASHPDRNQVLEALRTPARLQGSQVFRLVQERGPQGGILMVEAVRDPAGSLRGYVLGVYRIQDLMARALADYAKVCEGLHLRLVDETHPEQPAVLGRMTAREGRWDGQRTPPRPKDAAFLWRQELPTGGRRWVVEAYPVPEALGGPRAWEAWATLAAGSFFCGLLGALLLATTGRTHLVEQKVEEQTLALRSSEAELLQKSRLLDQSQQAAQVGGWELDLDSGHLYWTDETFRLHGREPGSFQPTWERALGLLEPEGRAQVEASFLHARTLGEGWDLEVEIRAEKQARWLQFIGRPVLQHGRLHAFFGSYQDISSRKFSERLKNEFISVVSHELRTPLTAIKGSLGLVRAAIQTGVPVKVEEMVQMAERNNDRLILLVNDLLDMEKVRIGRLDLTFAAVDLSLLVDEALDDNAGYGAQFGVRFLLDRGLSGTKVIADSQRVVQVIVNLLSNAAKFSPSGEAVHLSMEARPNHFLRLSIRDLGPGVPAAFRNRIFHPFAQADSSDGRAKGGTGLGLSICKALVERMGGHIGFDSEEGKGSTFWFELPMA